MDKMIIRYGGHSVDIDSVELEDQDFAVELFRLFFQNLPEGGSDKFTCIVSRNERNKDPDKDYYVDSENPEEFLTPVTDDYPHADKE